MTSKNWQLTSEAAKRYQDVLVKYILGAFAEALVDWASLDVGISLVDVGCGTGAATRYAAQKVGASGQVVGIDVNPEMLKVAQSLPQVDGASIEWRQENAYALSSEDKSVDAVLSAQVVQFIPEKVKALQEMRRVLKVGGALYISLWTDISNSPYFDALVDTIAQQISPDAASGLGTAFGFSNREAIVSVFADAGFEDVITDISTITLTLPPLREFIPQHIRATPMGIAYDSADEATRASITETLLERLDSYTNTTGASIPFQSHWIKATKS